MTFQWTPTEQRIWNVLRDGMAHHKQELHVCLDDELTINKDKSLGFHLCNMNRKLRRSHLNISCLGKSDPVMYQVMQPAGNLNDE
jgi:hypothetical protein